MGRLSTNLKTVNRIRRKLESLFVEAEIDQKKVAVVSAIGSDLKISGMLASASSALADAGIDILAVHQCMRQVEVQFVINEQDYQQAVKTLHAAFVEVFDHGRAICLAS